MLLHRTARRVLSVLCLPIETYTCDTAFILEDRPSNSCRRANSWQSHRFSKSRTEHSNCWIYLLNYIICSLLLSGLTEMPYVTRNSRFLDRASHPGSKANKAAAPLLTWPEATPNDGECVVTFSVGRSAAPRVFIINNSLMALLNFCWRFIIIRKLFLHC